MSLTPFPAHEQVAATLAENASAHCVAANRLLLAVLAVAFVVLVTDPLAPDAKSVTIPLLDIALPMNAFGAASLFVLSFFMCAFACAQAQAFLAQRYAHSQIDALAPDEVRNIERTRFDRMLVGTFSRVATFDQALAASGLATRTQCATVYVFLKSLYYILAFMIPFAALAKCIGMSIQQPLWLRVSAMAVSLIATILFLILFCLEIAWVNKRVRYWHPKETPLGSASSKPTQETV